MTTTAAPQRVVGGSIEILDELENLIGASRRLPFSSSVVINEEDALDLVDRARLGLPQEVVEAHHTLVDSERIIHAAEDEAETLLAGAQAQAAETVALARAEAERLVVEAQARAAQLVSESEVVRTARERADELTTQAQVAATAVQKEADAYAREVMEELDGHLTKALTTVRKGLETLPRGPVEAKTRRRS